MIGIGVVNLMRGQRSSIYGPSAHLAAEWGRFKIDRCLRSGTGRQPVESMRPKGVSHGNSIRIGEPGCEYSELRMRRRTLAEIDF